MKNDKKVQWWMRLSALTCLTILSMSFSGIAQNTWKAARGMPEKAGKDAIRIKRNTAKKNELQFEYALPKIQTHKREGVSVNGMSVERLELGNAPLKVRPGEPVLPVLSAQIILPPETIIDEVKLKAGSIVAVSGVHQVEFGQKPIALTPGAERSVTKPDEKIYSSDNAYPSKQVEVVGVYIKRGVRIAVINVNPIIYHPKSGQLLRYETISLSITTKPDTVKQLRPRISKESSTRLFMSVENPEDTASYSTFEEPIGSSVSPQAVNPAQSFRYVIITNVAMRDAVTDYTLRDLVARKQSQGISATIVTVDSIYSQYTGIDNAQKIRNFITDAYTNWETDYVLLAGDVNIIPVRYLYDDGTTIPSDLYYQCLDGNFNNDGDSNWGEPNDGPGGTDVDLMAEVAVGRASAETAQEMSNFVYKTIAYNSEMESSSYLRRATMVGEYLGSQFGPGIYGYAYPEMKEIHYGSTASGYSTTGFNASASFSVDSLDDYISTWSASQLITRFNSNATSIYNHLGHANETNVMKLTNSNVDALTNTKPIFIYSQGCYPGDFTTDCIAEHFTTTHRYGAFAVVFNSRYGYGAYNDADATLDGPSQRFDRQFWDAYFSEYILTYGDANADSHEDNIWDINGTYIRWCMYETNLFGDPQLFIRGQVLGPMVQYVSHVTSDVAGNSDGIINPGEQISVLPTISNVGSDSAQNISLEITTTDPYVSIIDNTASVGSLSCCGSSRQALDNFVIRVAANCPTPRTVSLTMTARDNAAGVWTSTIPLTVYTSSQLSGYVRTITGANPISGATISFSGPISGSVRTNSQGAYMFGGIDGTYTITATASGYTQSAPQSITIPPSIANVNFTLGRSMITVTPGSINRTVFIGDSTQVPFSVLNTGDLPLIVSVSVDASTTGLSAPATKNYDSTHFVVINKGANDNRLGDPQQLTRGGPDAFGYRWMDSREPGGPAYAWTDISSTGRILSTVSSCDDCNEQLTLSFPFKFYGTNFTSCYVSSNGYLTFGTASSQYSNYPLPSTSMPANLIAGFYDDLYPSVAGDVYFQDLGDRAIVQFNGVSIGSSSTYTSTFQIVLRRNGIINLYYQRITGSQNSCTVGIQNATQAAGLNVVYNAAYLTDLLAVEFRTTPPWISSSPERDTIEPGTTGIFNVRLASAGLSGGRYTGSILLSHNAPGSASPFVVPCTLSVDGMRRLTVSPQTINFGTHWVGSRDTAALTLTNSGDEATLVSSVSSANTNFRCISVLPITVPLAGSAQLRVIYQPGTIGNHSGIVTITSNAEDNPSLAVSVSGTSISGPSISVTPGSLSHVMVSADSLIDNLQIRNNGGDTLKYSITLKDSVTSLDLHPLWDKPQQWDLSRTAENGLLLSQNSSILNRKLAGEYPLYDGFESGNWSNWTAGTGSYTRSVTNTTAAKGTYSFTQVGGTSSHYNGVYQMFSQSQQPEIVSYSVRSSSASTNSGYFVLGQTGSCAIFCLMKDNGVIYVNENVSFTYLANVWYNIKFEINWATRTFNYYVNNSLIAPNIGFRDQVSSLSEVHLYNYSNTQAWWDEINIGGNIVTDWLSANPLIGTVNPGETANVVVGFNSSGLVGGRYVKNIQIISNSPEQEIINVPCTLTVDGFRRLAVRPASVNFHSKWVGQTDTAFVILTNSGNEATQVTSITSTNAVFSYSATLPLTIAAFDSAKVRLLYHPDAAGYQSASINIQSNAEDNPSLSISVSGTSTNPPAASLFPDSLHFTLSPSNAPASLTSVLSNTGSDTLTYQIVGVNETGNPITSTTIACVTKPKVMIDRIYSAQNYRNPFFSGRLIVGMVEGSTVIPLALLDKVGAKGARELAIARNPKTGLAMSPSRKPYLITLNDTSSEAVLKAISLLRDDPAVAYAEPDYQFQAIAVPNDPSFSQLYAMQNIGQSGGTVDADIDATDVWERHTGNKNILLGIIDTGIDYLHPDLAGNIWTNPGEIPGNGIDDDHNGFTDDIHGWDFAYDDSNPMDGHYHGTHCAGTIAGVGNNGVGVAGVMWNANIVALKFLDDAGSGSSSDAIDAVNYATAMGIQITSNSWGGGAFSQALMDAIATGGLFVAAAGNDGTDNDVSPHYPSSYNLDNVLAVAATDRNDLMAYFSCYGGTSVDLGAPGVDIYSCAPNSNYQLLSGTSMATPHVSGSAGLIWSYNPMLTALEVKRILMENVDSVSSLAGKTVTGGRLNVAKALAAAGPAWLSASPLTAGRVAPGGSANLTVTVDPAGLEAGQWLGQILVATNDPVHSQLPISITADISGCRSLTTSMDTINFRSLWAGRRDTIELILSNSCNAAVTISQLTTNDINFSVQTSTPILIPPFGNFRLKVIFSPNQVGRFTSNLIIVSNAMDHPTISVRLTGTATVSPAITVNPVAIAMSLNPGQIVNQPLIIKNSGGDTLNFNISGSMAGGSILNPGQSGGSVLASWISVAPTSGRVIGGDSAAISVTFNATGRTAGIYQDTLKITHNAPSQATPLAIPLQMTVSGTRSLIVNPSSIVFDTIINGAVDTVLIRFVNRGNSVTRVSALSLSNNVFHSATVLPFTVLAFDSMTVPLLFSPVVAGIFSGSLTITSDAQDNPSLIIPLSGVGTVGPAIVVTPSQIALRLSANRSAERTVSISNTGDRNLSWSILNSSGGLVSRETHDTIPGTQSRTYLATHDISCDYWSDAGNDAFDGFGYPTVAVGGVSSRICMTEGQSSYTINGYQISVKNDFAENHIYRSIIEPAQGSAARSDVTVNLTGDVGSDGSETVYLDSVLVNGTWMRFYVNEYSFPNSDPRVVFLIVPSNVAQRDSVRYWRPNSGYVSMEARNISLPATVYVIPSYHSLSSIKQWFQNDLVSRSNWLSATPKSGVTTPGQVSNFKLSFATAGMQEGTYYDTIRIMHNGVPATPISIPVVLTVDNSSVAGISRIMSIGSGASLKMEGNSYSLQNITIGSPVSGTVRSSRYRLVFR